MEMTIGVMMALKCRAGCLQQSSFFTSWENGMGGGVFFFLSSFVIFFAPFVVLEGLQDENGYRSEREEEEGKMNKGQEKEEY